MIPPVTAPYLTEESIEHQRPKPPNSFRSTQAILSNVDKGIPVMTRSILTATLAALVSAGAAHAQVSTQQENQGQAAQDQTRQEQALQDPARQGQARQGQTQQGQASADQQLDSAIAACLLLANKEEIAVANFAKDRAQNEQVQQFAQQMIEDHQQAAGRLMQAVPQLQQMNLDLSEQAGGQARPSGQARTGQAATLPGRSAQNQPGGRATTTAQGGDMHSKMMQLQQKAAQECLKLTVEQLSKQDGEKFDKAYMGQQISAHVGMLAKLRASESFASGQLQDVIGQLQQTTQQHLQLANQICEQMESQSEGQPGAQASREAEDGALR